jgi:sialate O-acetylesterase
MEASDKPQLLTVAGTNSLTMRDVLVGDVWLCSGDFGTYYETYAAMDAANELANANYPSIRLLKVKDKTSNVSLKDIDGEWTPCGPMTVNSFSALAYFFGRALHKELKVPIGLIDCSYRYSYIRTWTAPEGFRAVPELKVQRDKMDSWDSTTETGRAAFSAAIDKVEKWLPHAEKALREVNPIPAQPFPPAPTPARTDYGSIGELSVAYHGMVAPLVPFAIRGVIWSQGENGADGDTNNSLRGLSTGWRQVWGQGDFPFFYEMLPQIGAPSAAPCGVDSWVVQREGHIKAMSMPNSGMIVTTDVSDFVSDARNRQDAGQRMALLALAKEYGQDIEYSGPLYTGSRVEGDSIVISFDHTGKGLMAGQKTGLAPVQEAKDGVLKHFAIAGADKQWYWADARIVGSTVVARSDKVPAPVAVRYAWCSNPQAANLYNRDGLPAVPFRTDAW